MTNKQQDKIPKQDHTPFVPSLDMRVLFKTAIITFVIGFIGFMVLFIYMATH